MPEISFLRVLDSKLKWGMAFGILGFFVSFTTSRSLNGRVTYYRDYGAIACGVLAVALAVWAYNSYIPEEYKSKKMLFFFAVMGLGVTQLVRGFGLHL
ncbi:MAG: hypothetical protein AAGD96_02605 [Chloroflexota bacterium]